MEVGIITPQPNRVKDRYFSVVSITLISSEEGEKEFHCHNCGWLIKKYKGSRVTQVAEAELLEAKKYDELICKRCRTLYRFL